MKSQQPTRMLCIGNDNVLLDIRRLVLQQAGYSVTALCDEQVTDTFNWSAFEIVILCHTLSSERVRELTELLQSRDIALPIICLTSFMDRNVPDSSIAFEVIKGPSKLIEKLATLQLRGDHESAALR